MRLALPAALFMSTALPALAAPPVIVVDTPVTGSLVAEVLGDLGKAHVLISAGADPHHYQMRPSDARALQSAGLLVWTGAQLTPWMERAAENLSEGKRLELLTIAGTHLRSYADSHDHQHDADEDHDHAGDHDHDHAHDHDHEHEHEHEHAEGEGHDHPHSGTDPHAWLDPANAELWLSAIAEAVAAQDPDNAASYRANAKAAADRVAALDAKIAATLQQVAQQRFVVFHDAYGYFTDHYGLLPAIAVSLGDASAPSAARLAAIRNQITESGAVCAFPEFGHDPSLIDSVVEGGTIRIGDELDPAGRGFEAGSGLYEALLLGMADTIAGCLSEKK